MRNKTILFLCLAAISYLTACKMPNTKTKNLDPAALTAKNLGYAYGVFVSQQIFSSEQMNMTTAEKDIDQFVAGFEKGIEGDLEVAKQTGEVWLNRFVKKVASTTPKEAKEVAYSLGACTINKLSTQVDLEKNVINFDAIKTGFHEAEANQSKMDSITVDSIMNDFFEVYRPELEAKRRRMQKKIKEEQQAQLQVKQKMAAAKIDSNIVVGASFLAANAKKEGVVTLASGLQYKIVKKGTGIQPTINDKVKMHYHGTTIDGKVFGSSVNYGKPGTYNLKDAIQGWQEGIPLMKEGAKYIFYIPQELAYGTKPFSAKIPAGSTLIVEIELITVNPMD